MVKYVMTVMSNDLNCTVEFILDCMQGETCGRCKSRWWMGHGWWVIECGSWIEGRES